MSRALVTINTAADRQRVAAWAAKAPWGTRVEFKQAKRTLPQNDRLWAMLTDFASQVQWHGQKLTPDDWKLLFMDDLGREVRIVPALSGKGFVNLSTRSSDLSVGEMTDLIELIFKWGAEMGVTFNEPKKSEAA